jgi:hypothetical protein
LRKLREVLLTFIAHLGADNQYFVCKIAGFIAHFLHTEIAGLLRETAGFLRDYYQKLRECTAHPGCFFLFSSFAHSSADNQYYCVQNG